MSIMYLRRRLTKPRELVIKSQILGSYVGVVLVEEYVKSWTVFMQLGTI
jgi:hypothetical protein